jgi:mannosyltransferase
MSTLDADERRAKRGQRVIIVKSSFAAVVRATDRAMKRQFSDVGQKDRSINGLSAMGVEGTSDCSSWYSHLICLLPILLVYIFLAFYGIGRQGLWEDEYLSVLRLTSRHPIWKDGHGFVYFALLKVWIQLGDSEFILRSLSVLLGTLAVCLVYMVGVTLLNRRAAVFATAIFATSPFLIWYSQEVRYITLVLATTLLSMFAFCRLFSRPSLGCWLTYGSMTVLAFFSFLSTLLLSLVQGLYLLASPSRHAFMRKWIACQLVLVVVFAFWFFNATHFVRAMIEAKDRGQEIISNVDVFPFTADFNEVKAAVIPYTFFAFSAGFTIGPAQRELYAERSLAPLAPHTHKLLALAVLYGILLVSGWLALRGRDSGVLLFLWIGVPVLGVFVIAKLLDIYYDVRYVSMALPAYILVLAAGIVRFGKFGVQISLLGAVLIVHGVALANYYFEPRYAREDTRAAANFLESATKPRDLILVVGTVGSLPYYYRGNPPLVNARLLKGSDHALATRLRELTENRSRIWLVQIRPWQTDRSGKIKAALDGGYRFLDRRHFPGVDLYLYQSDKL